MNLLKKFFNIFGIITPNQSKISFNLYNPGHYKILNDFANSICSKNKTIEDIPEIFTLMSSELLKYNITFSIDDYVKFRGEYFRRLYISKTIALEYLSDDIQNKESKKIYERDSRGRFKRKEINETCV